MAQTNENETILLVGAAFVAWYFYTKMLNPAAAATAINPNTGAQAPAGYGYQYNPQTGQYQLVPTGAGSLFGYGAPTTPTSATFPPPAAPNGYYYGVNPGTGAYQLYPNPLGGGYGIQQSVFSSIGSSIGSLFSGIFGSSSAPGVGSQGSSFFNGANQLSSNLGTSSIYQQDASIAPTPNPSDAGLNYQIGATPLNLSSDLNIPGLALNSGSGSYSGSYGS